MKASQYYGFCTDLLDKVLRNRSWYKTRIHESRTSISLPKGQWKLTSYLLLPEHVLLPLQDRLQDLKILESLFKNLKSFLDEFLAQREGVCWRETLGGCEDGTAIRCPLSHVFNSHFLETLSLLWLASFVPLLHAATAWRKNMKILVWTKLYKPNYQKKTVTWSSNFSDEDCEKGSDVVESAW